MPGMLLVKSLAPALTASQALDYTNLYARSGANNGSIVISNFHSFDAGSPNVGWRITYSATVPAGGYLVVYPEVPSGGEGNACYVAGSSHEMGSTASGVTGVDQLGSYTKLTGYLRFVIWDASITVIGQAKWNTPNVLIA